MRLLAALAATLLLAANPLATTREAGQQPPAGAAPPGTPAIRITEQCPKKLNETECHVRNDHEMFARPLWIYKEFCCTLK